MGEAELTNNTRRIMWLDILKGISMLFIIMSHSRPPIIFTWLYTPFFLTAFFFASGYTFNPNKNAISYLRHKSKTILLPYWIFGIINSILACSVDKDNIFDRLLGLLLSINRRNDDLWFVKCLFTMQILFYCIWHLLFKRRVKYRMIFGGTISSFLCAVGYLLVSANIQIPFQLETSLIMMPFMFLGYFVRINGKIDELKKPSISLSLIAVYICFCVLAKNTVNIHGEKYSSFIIFLAQAILGTISIILISKFIEDKFKCNKLINYLVFIGQNTFVYYAFQSKAIRLLDILFKRFPFVMNDYFRNVLYAILVSIILAIPALIINRWFPFILGRKKLSDSKLRRY